MPEYTRSEWSNVNYLPDANGALKGHPEYLFCDACAALVHGSEEGRALHTRFHAVTLSFRNEDLVAGWEARLLQALDAQKEAPTPEEESEPETQPGPKTANLRAIRAQNAKAKKDVFTGDEG